MNLNISDFLNTETKYTFEPELLTHPNIPKPLHGLNPRTIKGQAWWDVKRRASYAEKRYKCFACGCSPNEDRIIQRLEAHEDYSVNYLTGEVKLNRIVALCHSCHAFIHSGLLTLRYHKGELSRDDTIFIFDRGFKILKDANLKPWFGTAEVYADEFRPDLKSKAVQLRKEQDTTTSADWSDWHIVIDGRKHYTKFQSFEDWQEHYKP